MGNPQKDLRKQLKNLVQEALPEVLSAELEKAIYKELMDAMNARLSKIEANVKETLDLIDQRSKDTLSYLVRQTSVSQPSPESTELK